MKSDFFALKYLVVIGGLLVSHACLAEELPNLSYNVQAVTDPLGKSFSDLLNDRAVDREKESELIFQEPPGKAQTFLDNLVELNRAELANLNPELIMTEQIKLINRSLYGEGTKTPLQQQQLHVDRYCSSDSATESSVFNCSGGNSKEKQHGEIKISSFLGKEAIAKNDRDQYLELIRLFADPVPKESAKPLVSSREELDKPASQEELIKLRSSMSHLSAATSPLYHALQIRMQPETQTSLVPGLSPEISQGKSVMQVLTEETTRRLKDEQWPVRVSEASAESLLRELVHMEAIRLRLELLKYQQGERIEFMLAAQTAATLQSSGGAASAIDSAGDF